MRLIFAGTPEFARVALERLLDSGHTIALVLTQPDRPAGRGLKLQASAVKQFALEHGLPVAQPRSLRLNGKYPDDAAAACQEIARAQADAMVVAAYGLILPQWVLDGMAPVLAAAPGVGASVSMQRKFGCFNIHGSLLPRWRGAAPIHRAIEAGDTQTGVTIMQMDAGLDTGDMLLVQSAPIGADDTTADVHDRLADMGANMVVQALDLADSGHLRAQPQPTEGITYAHKIEKHEAAINWQQDAPTIVRRVRAFNPFPGATAVLAEETIKVWAAQCAPLSAPGPDAEQPQPGTIVAISPEGIAVAAINSIVNLTQLQRPGGKRMPVGDFLRGADIQSGMRFEVAEQGPRP